MTVKEFDISLDEDLSMTKKTLSSKGQEYSTDDNRFHNLDKIQIMYSLVENKDSPFFPIYALFCKNFISLIDMIDGKQPITEEMVNEKVGDPIAYLYILKSKMKEFIRNMKNAL